MTFKKFLDDNNVTGISPNLIEGMDVVGSAILKLAFMSTPPSVPGLAIPPVPLAPLSLGAPVTAYVAAKGGGSPANAAGLPLLLAGIELDVSLLIITPMIANAVLMNTKPAPLPAIPIPPFPPMALAAAIIASCALKVPPVPDPSSFRFAKAALEWAASFVEGDARTGGGVTIIPLG